MSISSPPNYGSPDWQRGYYSAQKLLATIPGGTSGTVVNLPPNTETLSVVLLDLSNSAVVSCQGLTTGVQYPGVRSYRNYNSSAWNSFFFDVSEALDAQVQVTVTITPIKQWFVYADAGTHIVADTSKLSSTLGQQYIVPSAPSTFAGDHPPVELQLASQLNATTGTGLVAAPGAGKRIRVFDAFVNGSSTAEYVALRTHVTGAQIVGLSITTGNTAGHISCAPSGVPLPANEGIDLICTAGNIDGTVTYTVETI